ncbi:pilus assembly protein TadG-related protein [Labrys wisconsinensis]|uniref:Flp pilus assembly protein TadG n=1 Tax=Labrys wisconsinensis TaxID=425677 RepID=A0ABU0J7Q1_9HYPH|nr:pilus assembly protein TadG-related protein [Labrys wisconsinensis]MDQ0470284.1 Flp pilus assembly protein TadG [Labrys wisconsinensis]
MLFAFALIPVMGGVGVAVDYTRAATYRSQLDAIADAAALSAVSRTSVVNLANSSDNGKAATTSFFDAEAARVSAVTITKVTVQIVKTATALSATVSYSATVPNTFTQLIGMPQTAIGGTASSTTQLPIYQNFYLFLDNSPSMGIGATQADINNLIAATANAPIDPGCGFACHDLSGKEDFYTVAKKNGITMRIDEVRSATQALMQYATATEILPQQFGVSIYTFNNVLTRISGLTTSLGSAAASAAAIDLVSVPYQNYNADRYTDLDGLLPKMDYLMPSSGSGQTSASPQTVMFIVSDGVADEPTPGNSSGRTLAPITVAQCDAIKSRGITIAVLYTTYLPLPTNSFYQGNVAPFASQINPRMQSCASPGLFFEVSPGDGISQAMNALFTEIVSMARLTQ